MEIRVNIPSLDRLVDYLEKAGPIHIATSESVVKSKESVIEEVVGAVKEAEPVIEKKQEELTLEVVRGLLKDLPKETVKNAFSELGVAKLTGVKSEDYPKLLELVKVA